MSLHSVSYNCPFPQGKKSFFFFSSPHVQLCQCRCLIHTRLFIVSTRSQRTTVCLWQRCCVYVYGLWCVTSVCLSVCLSVSRSMSSICAWRLMSKLVGRSICGNKSSCSPFYASVFQQLMLFPQMSRKFKQEVLSTRLYSEKITDVKLALAWSEKFTKYPATKEYNCELANTEH